MHLGHTVFLLTMIVANMLKCNVFYWVNFCFCRVTPPIRGELSPAAWQCYPLVNLTCQVLFISRFLSDRTTNVSVIGDFSSVDQHIVCSSFDFISKWISWQNPKAKKIEAYSSTRLFVYHCCHMCSVALVLCVEVLVSEVVQWKSVHIKESTQSNTLKGLLLFVWWF